MSISINTSFLPFKLDLKEKKPVRMDIEVINRYDKPKKVILELLASSQIGFNKTSATKEKYEIGLLEPGQSKNIKIDIFPKNFAIKREEVISITATEITIEDSGYSFPSKKFKKNVGLEIK